MRNRWLLAFPMLIVASACASGGQPGQSVSPRSRSSRDLITVEELADVQVQNGYEAIQRLRPRWLMFRSGAGADVPVLFIENARQSSLDGLMSISVEMIGEIRFINARDATTRWGTGFPGGVIQVTLRN